MRNLLCVLSLFVMLVSCHNAENAEGASPVALVQKAPVGPDPTKFPERKLVRNGTMAFEVEDITTTRQKVSLLATEFGGYIFSEKRNNTRHEQVVRIPGDRFDEFISKVEGFAKTIDDEDFSSEDITEQFVDLETRLVAKKELEARFREIVKQAKTIEEILEVEQQIGYVHSEIEQIEGKLNYMSSKTSYSTITLNYYQPGVPIELPGTGTKFVMSFLDGWSGLVAFLVGITSVWPFIFVMCGSTWLIVRYKRRETVKV